MERVLIVANSELPKRQICTKLVEDSDYVIACDGGLTTCFSNDYPIDLIIGDLDSITEDDLSKARMNGIEILKIEDQECNDLSKAIAHAEKMSAQRVDIIGVQGGQSDHQMANYFAILENEINAFIHLDDCMVTTVCKSRPFVHSIEFKRQFSVFSIGISKGVKISGSNWTLDDGDLKPSSKGLHNFTTGNKLEISCEDGMMLIFLNY